jgi:hypothetical protein
MGASPKEPHSDLLRGSCVSSRRCGRRVRLAPRCQLLGEPLHRLLIGAPEGGADERRGKALSGTCRQAYSTTGDVAGVDAAMDAFIDVYEGWLRHASAQDA